MAQAMSSRPEWFFFDFRQEIVFIKVKLAVVNVDKSCYVNAQNLKMSYKLLMGKLFVIISKMLICLERLLVEGGTELKNVDCIWIRKKLVFFWQCLTEEISFD